MNLNYSEEAIKTVKSYTFMTDRFMTMAFNIPVAQHVLSVIMDTNLVVKSVKQQPIEDNFFSKSYRFDVLAEDDTGKIYNIEVQNSDEGANPKRARYNCELMDELIIRKGTAYADYPESYVIFITENDVLEGGLPIYHIDRYIKENGKPFLDGQYIIYVNGKNRDTSTALGQLMVDMQQQDATKISNKVLADRMKLLKQGEAFETMCKEVDKLTAEERTKTLAESVVNLVLSGSFTVDSAISILRVSSDIQTIVREKAQKLMSEK